MSTLFPKKEKKRKEKRKKVAVTRNRNCQRQEVIPLERKILKMFGNLANEELPSAISLLLHISYHSLFSITRTFAFGSKIYGRHHIKLSREY
ncbi:hypothetical protein V1477_013877 [Vespula maculifrons]|uniref:Uncharacterized protein n=1 Tax=Vespula maculifrons TaxID=7453 RepID=A0ABD2BPT5_VESMC